MPNWKKIIPLLNNKAKGIKNSLIYSKIDTALEIKYYYCNAIMDLVKFIRVKTKAKELGATHHVLKALFRWIIYQDRARLEISKDGRRVDIYVDDTRQEIEVKTISQMKIYDLWKKALGVIESSSQNLDSLWIFYFYRINWPKDNNIPIKNVASSNVSKTHHSYDELPTCHYLLVFITIDLLIQDSNSLKQDLMQLVEKSLENVAKKINIRPELIIPLENLIKVEDLERLVKQKEQELQDKEQELQDKDKIIQQLKDKLRNRK